MKIAYISGAYIPDRGADSVHVMSMCQAFASAGHEVSLYVRSGNEKAADDFAFYGVEQNFRIEKLHRPRVRVWGALVNARRAAASVKASNPDFIYAREVYGLAFALRSGIPFAYEVHWEPRSVPERMLLSWIFRQPNLRGVVFISARLRNIYLRQFPSLDVNKLLVAHDAANPVPMIPLQPDTAAFSRLRVGYVGGFLPGYGIDVLVELARKSPEFDFHVVGGRELAVKDWQTRSSDIANITFHGFVPPSQLSAHYRSFDVVIAPYQAATLHIDWISPMKLFEYMAHGKAIICADFPVMREILENGQDALLVSPSDLDAYRKALDELLDPGLRRKLGGNARIKLEQEFTWQKRAERLLSALTATTPSVA